MAVARVDAGVDPLYVGELVREVIENDWPYIFTDTEREPAVDAPFRVDQGRLRSHQGSHSVPLMQGVAASGAAHSILAVLAE